ncbi:MAG: pyridoxal-phosphate dependent enzyme [Lachnospiraceae bacterium]|jgi:D-cysteine desulfhydrase|nr:pyridoxal-phosphate dependent enzyme [Lachnospiraceae bacterium]
MINVNSEIQKLGILKTNHFFIKREDLIPYSFGGNKARKGLLFFHEIDRGKYDCVVTYGSSHSNHCRIIANMAASREMPCHIIEPEEVSDITFNSRMIELFGAQITKAQVKNVHHTIEKKIEELKRQGKRPYFIPGGGHGDIGTEAYVQCYREIKEYEEKNNIHFGYIFFASGTGTTQAGLVCGQLIYGDERKIIGISIARKNPYGENVIFESVCSYMKSKKIDRSDHEKKSEIIFDDHFTGQGYGKNNPQILQTIRHIMIEYGIPLDSTYTGKAFWGMEQYISQENVRDENILFIHTGGTPLYFDDISQI